MATADELDALADWADIAGSDPGGELRATARQLREWVTRLVEPGDLDP